MKNKKINLLATCFLVLFSINAFAVDTDGDGVDDVGGTVVYSTSFDLADAGWFMGWTRSNSFGSSPHTSGWGASTCGSLTCNPGPLNMAYTRNLTEPTVISFWAKSNSSTPLSELLFQVDGVSTTFFSLASTYKQIKQFVPPGNHVFKWLVNSTNAGYFVDDVSITTATDNCPVLSNSNQIDTDVDGQGDACDSDDDNDGVLDAEDNCPITANADQLDTDGDGQGNACDLDDDNDGATDVQEAAMETNSLLVDTDNDGINDNTDNCPLVVNPSQTNTNGSNRGDACLGGQRDSIFTPALYTSTNNNGNIQSVTTQADGKVLIAGLSRNASTMIEYGFARLNVDGSWDSGFNPVGLGGGFASKSVVLPDGKILITGIGAVNGTAIGGIARLNANGLLDTGFNPGGGPRDGNNNLGHLNTLAVQPDGKIIVGGSFASFNGKSVTNITRLNADGSLDSTFLGIGANNVVNSIVLQPDGKILIGGNFTQYDGVARQHLARLNSDGTLDSTFIRDLGGTVNAIVLQTDGKVLIGATGVTRVNSDGSLDAGFNVDNASATMPTLVKALVLQPDGKIIVGGAGGSHTGFKGVIRLNSDGTRDASFFAGTGVGGTDKTVHALAVQADGKLLAGGGFTSYDGAASVYITRIHTGNTDLDTIEDATDNCPFISNADQLNTDGDAQGNACDTDIDNDGVLNASDAFPNNPEAATDTDGDGMPDTILTQDAFDDNSLGGAGWPWVTTSGQWSAVNYRAQSTYSLGATRDLSVVQTVPNNSNLIFNAGGILDFCCKFSLYIDNILIYQKDGNLGQELPGGNAGSVLTFPVTAGTHTFKWSVIFGGGFSVDGKIWIDNVKLVPTNLVEDTDDDNDGIADTLDKFPLDVTESADNDKDGIGNNADTDDDNDGMPDVWETANGLNPLVSNAAGDADGDGYSNWQEFLKGTNPQDPLSHPVISVKNDYSNSKIAGFYWKGTSNGVETQNQIWQLTFPLYSANYAVPTRFYPPQFTDQANWEIQTTGDFNKDGDADVLWRNKVTAQWKIWQMQSGTRAAQNAPADFDLAHEWTVVGAGDTDKDGDDDVVLNNTSTGEVMIWEMQNHAITATHSVGTKTGYTVNRVGDFNNDGDVDLLFGEIGTDVLSIWEIEANSFVSELAFPSTGTGYNSVCAGDFDNDGDADILLLNSTDNQEKWFVMQNYTRTQTFGSANIGFRFIACGDYDGDGDMDTLWQRTSDDTNRIVLQQNFGVTKQTVYTNAFGGVNPGSAGYGYIYRGNSN